MGMILRIASSRIVGQGDIVGRSGYFSLNLSANSVMRGRLDARRTLKSLVADLRHINISSIMVDGKQMKVDLSVYDNDGQEGFFVPSSAFRDLSKDVGAQIGSQTIQMNSQSEGVEQFALGALQDAYRSTTQALSKNIKKNKAKLKYNTQVFLVNNKDKEQ